MLATPQVIIKDDEGGIDTVDEVADIAEVAPGTLQVVFRDESREMVKGSIFGGHGDWKIWFETRHSETVKKERGSRILTMPNDSIQWRNVDVPGSTVIDATIKRLKLPNL